MGYLMGNSPAREAFRPPTKVPHISFWLRERGIGRGDTQASVPPWQFVQYVKGQRCVLSPAHLREGAFPGTQIEAKGGTLRQLEFACRCLPKTPDHSDSVDQAHPARAPFVHCRHLLLRPHRKATVPGPNPELSGLPS